MKQTGLVVFLSILTITLTTLSASAAPTQLQADNMNPNPPAQPVKLIFIHHSTGENWLTDGYGDLGRTLAENNYFVSDTNYGWGPDSIGDRTDIPNWTEWFASDQTSTYMDALFSESGQNSSYTRLFDDPGGENQIVMFKSCFPNSALEGSPYDSPDPEGWLTVGHAKFVYNEILQYFATRPDKLFIVITAPPLSDPTYAENARAFNQWLANDWLDENDYDLPNVAVFDFFNILTDQDAHHRYVDGYIEHSYSSSNTLAYPSSDDHPSKAGSRKATEEFLPMLNIFYNRWAGTVPAAPQESTSTQEQPAPEVGVPLPPESVLSIDDFETGALEWEAFWDTSTTSTINCVAEQGSGSQGSTALRIDFSVAPGSWATCSRLFDSPQDWSAGEWLAYEIHASQWGMPFNVILYGGTPESVETYIHTSDTPVEYPVSFFLFTSLWNEFLRVEWEENPASPFEQPEQVVGLAFGFDGIQDTPYMGTIWIDNIHLEKSPTYEENSNPPDSRLPCLGAIILPLVLAGLAWIIRRR